MTLCSVNSRIDTLIGIGNTWCRLKRICGILEITGTIHSLFLMQSYIPSDKIQPTPETSSVVATAKHPVQSADVMAPASSVLDQEVIWGGLKTYSKNTSSPINRNGGL